MCPLLDLFIPYSCTMGQWREIEESRTAEKYCADPEQTFSGIDDSGLCLGLSFLGEEDRVSDLEKAPAEGFSYVWYPE